MKYIPDLLLITGAATLSYGAFLVYEPAGYITAGVLILLEAIMLSRKADA